MALEVSKADIVQAGLGGPDFTPKEWPEPEFVTTPLSMLRCSECGDLLDDGICENHGLLDPEASSREGDPAFNGAFDRW